MLPRFPDESEALPQFSLESTQERAPVRVRVRGDADKTLQQLAAEDLELIEDGPTPPPSIAPVALDASDLEDIHDESDDEIELEDDDLELPRRRLPWRGIAIGSALFAGMAAVALFARATSAADVSAVAATIAPPPPPPVVIAPPPPPPPPAPAIVEPPAPPPPAPTTGTIITPQWAKGRRVWIDGKPITGHAPKIEAVCGKHQVKIGAYSKTHKVDIPCGGEIKVAP
ncbi:MAG: hypothetical protein ACXWUG_14410 [Polyangiales bacterium]